MDNKNCYNTYTNDFKLNLLNICYTYKAYHKKGFKSDILFNEILPIYKNNVEYSKYLINAVEYVKKRFDEIESILKELNLTYLLVYTNEDREEMEKNGYKYDIILDTLISRSNILLEIIKNDEYIKKSTFIIKYLPLICVLNKSEKIFFLFGNTENDIVKTLFNEYMLNT